MALRAQGVLIAAAALVVGTSQAATLSFNCISNAPVECGIGEAQFSVAVTDLGGGEVRFDFRNTGTEAASITGVYFDDGTLLGIARLHDADENGGHPGVDFTAGSASPPVLPDGDRASPPFQVTQGFLADADPPPPKQGINPGEWLWIDFALQDMGTFADVVAELTTGALRIGLHAQAFEIQTPGSASFVNMPVPAPAAFWLFGAGLAGLSTLRRRR